jgi:hypothetical protein
LDKTINFRDLPAKKILLPFLNVLEHFTNRLMLINFVKALRAKDQSNPGISYFSDLSQTRCTRKIPKPVLETTLISK